jgi:hypothetical protein
MYPKRPKLSLTADKIDPIMSKKVSHTITKAKPPSNPQQPTTLRGFKGRERAIYGPFQILL